MEIKVDKIQERSMKLNKIFKTDNSFKSILKEKKEKKDLLTKDELSEIYDKSTNIKVFGSILKIDMKSGKDKYTKENGKVNLKDILAKYGDKVDTKGLNELSGVLTSMFKEGLLDEEDYFEGLKWIERKIFEKSIQINIDKKKFEIIQSLKRE